MDVLFVIVAIILIGFFSSLISIKIKYRNWIEVNGQIIEFVEENDLHFPVFSYNTKYGKNIISRNTPKNNEKYFEEASIEKIFPLENDAQEFLKRALPINEVLIKYNPEFPEQFIPKY